MHAFQAPLWVWRHYRNSGYIRGEEEDIPALFAGRGIRPGVGARSQLGARSAKVSGPASRRPQYLLRFAGEVYAPLVQQEPDPIEAEERAAAAAELEGLGEA